MEKTKLKRAFPHHSTPKKSQAILKWVRQIPNFNLILIFLHLFFLKGGWRGGAHGGNEREKYLSPEAAYIVMKNLRNGPIWPRETSGQTLEGCVCIAVWAHRCWEASGQWAHN